MFEAFFFRLGSFSSITNYLTLTATRPGTSMAILNSDVSLKQNLAENLRQGEILLRDGC
jgi:hypothetical protein